MSQLKHGTLILIPTAFELKGLGLNAPTTATELISASLPGSPNLGLCGFGLAAAGSLASLHISVSGAQRVLLLGIAGSFDLNSQPLASLVVGREVSCQGIGVSADPFSLPPIREQSATELGFSQLPHGDAGLAQLAVPKGLGQEISSGKILSVAEASASSAVAAARREEHPECVIEDMETWAVNIACVLAGIPLHVVRAVSNAVGQRDKSQWQTKAALEELSRVLPQILTSLDESNPS